MTEPNLERQQSVFDLLHQFKGTEPVKQLFWSELNYDRINTHLSRRGWGEAVAGGLADDPLLLASGANDFHVIYSRLNSDKLLMGVERPVVSKLLKDHPYALFLFSNSKQDQFHFLNVKYDDDVQKRRLFRRITVGPHERLRTASERIALLDLADISPNLFGLSPLAVQQRHDQAFDVEPVTKEFFSEYHRIFEEVEESITGFGRDKERRHLYTQRLFNRLMFIAFIEKKGWLKLNGNSDYLTALWKAHLKDDSVSDKNFYRDRLKSLFWNWLAWFGGVTIEAQRRTLALIEFLIEKAKLFDRLKGQLNERQQKALLRMFKEGPEGFKGGLSAGKYSTITGASPATATRDLADLTDKGALVRTGELRHARYTLSVPLKPVPHVTVSEDGQLVEG